MSSLLRRCTAWLLACGIAAAAAGAAAQDVDRATLLRVGASVMKIEAIGPQGRFQLGSGVVVAPGKVVTNCHVTRNAERVHVVRGGVRWSVRAQAADLPHDLCLLHVPRMEGEPIPIAYSANLRVGQGLLAVGYGGGAGIQSSEGAVVALHDWSGSRIIQSTNWFNSGASGGGLFDEQGALVGILTFRLRGGAAHYFSAPADWLLERIDDDSRYVPVAPLAGQSFWERPADEQPLFLQAAALEQRGQWDALARLARRWSQGTNDPEAAYLLGVAYDGLDRTDEAADALRRCLETDPGYSRAWVRLAQVYKRQGKLGAARGALASLAPLDPKLAQELSSELEKP